MTQVRIKRGGDEEGTKRERGKCCGNTYSVRDQSAKKMVLELRYSARDPSITHIEGTSRVT